MDRTHVISVTIFIFLFCVILCTIDRIGCRSGYDTESYDNVTSININPQQERRIKQLEDMVTELRKKVDYSYNVIKKVYDNDMEYDYVMNGWFVVFHDIMDSPNGNILGAPLNSAHGIKNICFRSRDSDPYLGHEIDKVLFPRSDEIGFRAMTVWKVPVTGTYDFKVLTDDGMKLFYQKVNADIVKTERNARNKWIPLIDAWEDQTETWITSNKINLNQSDLILLRMDYYENGAFASACIKLRYYESTDDIQETMVPEKDIYCSLLWNHVPIIGKS